MFCIKQSKYRKVVHFVHTPLTLLMCTDSQKFEVKVVKIKKKIHASIMITVIGYLASFSRRVHKSVTIGIRDHLAISITLVRCLNYLYMATVEKYSKMGHGCESRLFSFHFSFMAGITNNFLYQILTFLRFFYIKTR